MLDRDDEQEDKEENANDAAEYVAKVVHHWTTGHPAGHCPPP